MRIGLDGGYRGAPLAGRLRQFEQFTPTGVSLSGQRLVYNPGHWQLALTVAGSIASLATAALALLKHWKRF